MSGVSAGEVIQNSLEEAKLLLGEYVGSAENREAQVRLADKLAKTFADGGKVLIAGNGGSMSDAIHFAEEWTGRFRADRRPYPAMALADASHLTCIAND
jgi:D-sedoheptulose 7-phosphate isomerase